MSVRLLLFMLVATALAFAPFVMPMAEASAAPAGHHEAAMNGSMAGHCDDTPAPAPAKSDHHKAKPCCAAGCMAAATIPTAGDAAVVLTHVAKRPGLDRFHRGHLAEIATPPPRRA
ncbi:hypothetical protein LZ496_05470 [Sphingomonas sp. NSE70-1]|uniref:CopL family metal-binding regulatory protein n=1 Tax=Sphingomonas caseinilyticus TaxID=2908205 RepID=A0ABT0RTE3_9SPHN|nr:hypothetical protein [Sphingomonas caseinilyticus]MCL6698231.1 hypothetical protein [Sphingomonas caseinilyticus]